MRKRILQLLVAYIPFLYYATCVAFLYFICFYYLPKNTIVLADVGFYIIYLYIGIIVWVMGYHIGKIVTNRCYQINFFIILIYAILSAIILFFVGGLESYFWSLSNGFSFTKYDITIYIKSFQCKSITIGTFLSYLIGSVLAYKKRLPKN